MAVEEKLTKELILKLMAIKGEARGATFKTDAEFVLQKEGEIGLKVLEERLTELGCPIKYKEIKSMAFYPLGLRMVSLLAIKEVFNFDEEKIKEMGQYAPKTSVIIKFMLRYFTFPLPQKLFQREAPKGWRKHYTVGELIPVELNQEKKCFIVRLKDFDFHPLFCIYLKGYFLSVIKMLVRSSQITGEETQCTFKGDQYHEFQIKWQ